MKNKATPPIKQPSKLDKYFKKVESTLSSNVKVFIGAALLYVGFLGSWVIWDIKLRKINQLLMLL